jgi:hypothetical protein
MKDPSLVHAGTTEVVRNLSVEHLKWKPDQTQDNHVKHLL